MKSRRTAIIAAAVLAGVSGVTLALSDRWFLFWNVPMWGSGVVPCGTTSSNGHFLRICGDDELGPLLEEEVRQDGLRIRRWYFGGIEYLRELKYPGDVWHSVYRTVAPCWNGVSWTAAGGPPDGALAMRCIEGVGLAVPTKHGEP
jgi:hypothetical protein